MRTLLRCSRGFSLHDLIVTLAIGGSLLAFGMPAVTGLVNRTQSVSALNEMLTTLALARSEAIRRGQDMLLCPSLDGERCATTAGSHAAWQQGWLVAVDSNANRERDADEAVVYQSSMPANGLGYLSSRYRSRITYQPDGTAGGSNATFTLCDRRGRALGSVLISNTGRARSSRRNTDQLSCPQ